jgi:hypothetical protein
MVVERGFLREAMEKAGNGDESGAAAARVRKEGLFQRKGGLASLRTRFWRTS